jgi:hypothetical protein
MATRKFWLTIRDEKSTGLYSVALMPYRYRTGPRTMSSIAFVSQRKFSSPTAAVQEMRSLFGNTMSWKPSSGGRLRASILLKSSEVEPPD